MELTSNYFSIIKKRRFYSFALGIVCIISFLPSSLTAQYNGSFDFSAGIDYSYVLLVNDDIDPSSFFSLGASDRLKGGMGYKVSIAINSNLNEDSYLKFGMKWSEHRMIKYSERVLGEKTKLYKFNFLEFPIAVRRDMQQRHFSPYVEFEISPIIFLNTESKFLEREIEASNEYEGNMNAVDMSASIAGGYNLKFKERWAMFYQVSYRIHLVGIDLQFASKHHFYNFGFETGFRYFI